MSRPDITIGGRYWTDAVGSGQSRFDITIGGREKPTWMLRPRIVASAAAAPIATAPATAKKSPEAKRTASTLFAPPEIVLREPLDFAVFGRQLDRALSEHGDVDAAAWVAVVTALPGRLQDFVWRAAQVRLCKHSQAMLNRPANGPLRRHIEQARSRPSGAKQYFQTSKQEFDAYIAVFRQFACPMARLAFGAGQVAMLSLRNESSTLAHRGEGSYDDLLVVLRKIGRSGIATLYPICTEPGAQYSQRAGPGKNKGRVDARYAQVNFNKIEGEDNNKDGIKDAGRLIEGNYRYYEKPGGHLKARAFWVLPKGHVGPALSSFRQVAERDTDGDGRFTSADDSRIDRIGAGISMFIHRGGDDAGKNPDTYSAGCQTIPYNRYPAFLKSVGQPESFFYVLVNAER